MSEFKIDENAFMELVDKSMLVGADLLLKKVMEKVPRDLENLPINTLNRKDWKAPKRNVRKNNKHYYRKPVKISWNYYSWITWALKRSIAIEKLWKWEYIVWVKRWPTEKYAWKLEFSDQNKVNRSYLRVPLRDNAKEIINKIQETFNDLSK